jgi:DNA topoisomerase I
VDQEFTAHMEDNLDKVSAAELDWKLMLKDFYTPFIKSVEKAVNNIEEMKNVLDEPTDYVCEKCGRKMVKKIGRYGYFLACPGFPECKNAKAIPIGPCPTCGEGHVIMRATKRGRPFYGCDRYPECEFSTWDKPTGELCPVCGKILLEKSSKEKGKFIGCSTCDFEEEVNKTA